MGIWMQITCWETTKSKWLNPHHGDGVPAQSCQIANTYPQNIQTWSILEWLYITLTSSHQKKRISSIGLTSSTLPTCTFRTKTQPVEVPWYVALPQRSSTMVKVSTIDLGILWKFPSFDLKDRLGSRLEGSSWSLLEGFPEKSVNTKNSPIVWHCFLVDFV